MNFPLLFVKHTNQAICIVDKSFSPQMFMILTVIIMETSNSHSSFPVQWNDL